MMDSLVQDIRYALRSFRRSPAFTVAALIALALGIGANAAIFSVVYAVLFRPLPYPGANRLVMLWETRSDIDPAIFPDPKAAAAMFSRWPAGNLTFDRWQERNRSFEHIAGFGTWTATLTGAGAPERTKGLTATPDLFPLLGVHPTLGRTFLPEENREGHDDVIVLGHGLWRRRFGADPGVLGKKLDVDGKPHTIIGVMPAGFEVVLPDVAVRRPDFVLPLWHETVMNRGFTISPVLGKLKPGVTLAAAQSEMSALAAGLAQEDPRRQKGHGVRLVPLAREVSGDARPAMLVLLGAVGCVLLICCANVANLLLARASARQQEIGVRAVLGASRWRLARQMLTESVLLAAAGGAAGLLLARWGVQLLVAAIPEGTVPRIEDIHVDAAVLAFGFALALITGLLFGLAPALEAAHWSARSRQGTTRRSRRLRNALAVSEIAIALVLLTGAGLLVRSFIRLRAVDLGFHAENVLSVPMMVTDAKYADAQRRAEFAERVLERVQAMPGVQAAAITNSAPMAAEITATVSGIEIESRPGMEASAMFRTVTPDYFRTMGIAMRKGRAFTWRDAPGTAAIVNQAFIKRYLPAVRDDSPEPLGRHIKWNDKKAVIVGVVSDVKSGGANADAEPELYMQHTETFSQGLGLVVRTPSNPSRLTPLIRAAIREINPDQPIGRVATMEEVVSESFATPRFHMLLLGIFAALALALAAVGIYGVIAYSVTQRTHEIGVRMALGAERAGVLRLIIGQSLRLALAGVALGLAAAAAVTRVLAKFLFGVQPVDAVTFASVAALLVAVAAAAGWLPARRATRVDPISALRSE
ncbi:MAG: ABC transporter permease [Acidobacteriota bacterium]